MQNEYLVIDVTIKKDAVPIINIHHNISSTQYTDVPSTKDTVLFKKHMRAWYKAHGMPSTTPTAINYSPLTLFSPQAFHNPAASTAKMNKSNWH